MTHLQILSDNFEKQFCWDDIFSFFFFFQVKKCLLVTFREKKKKKINSIKD